MEVSVLYDELVRIFDPRRGGGGTGGTGQYANPEVITGPLTRPDEIRSVGRVATPPLTSNRIPDDWLDVVDTHAVDDADGYVLLTPPLALEKEIIGSVDIVAPPIMASSSPVEADDLHDGQWTCPSCTFSNTLPLYARGGPKDPSVTCAMCEDSFPFPCDPIPSPRAPASSPVLRIPRLKIPYKMPTQVPPPPARPSAPSAELPPRYRKLLTSSQDK